MTRLLLILGALLLWVVPVQAFDSLMPGATPGNFSVPAGWSVYKTQNFESGAVGSGEFIWGTISTAKPHSGSRSNLGVYSGSGQRGGWGIDSFPGTELYISWWEWIDSNARFNTEFAEFQLLKNSPVFQEVWWTWYYSNNFNDTVQTMAFVANGNRDIASWLNSRTVPSGAWHQYEVHFKPNTSTLDNGSMQIYLDGTLLATKGVSANLNGSANMAGSRLSIGGTYTKLLWWTDSSMTVCSTGTFGYNPPESLNHAKNICDDFATCPCPPTPPTFNRYIDDIIVLVPGSGGGGSVPDVIPPTPPTSLALSQNGAGQITATWVNGSDANGITGSTILRCTLAACAPTVTLATVTGSTLTYTDTTTSAGLTYGYAVNHVDAAGNRSSNSATVYNTSQVTSTVRTIAFTDTFDRANGAPGANWTGSYTGQNDFTIVSNGVRATALATRSVMVYNGATAADQWAKTVISTFSGAVVTGTRVLLRTSTSPTFTAYGCSAELNNTPLLEIQKITAGTPVNLVTSTAYQVVAGDELLCEVEGATIRLYTKSPGQSDILRLSTTDSTLTSGKTGVTFFVNTAGDLANSASDSFAMGGFSAAVGGTIAFDAVSSSADTTVASPLNWLHPMGTVSNGALLACLQARGTVQANLAGSTVTYDGTPMSFIRGDTRNDGAGVFYRTELWRLLNPTAGSKSVAATWVGTPTQYAVGSAISFSGVDQTTPIDAQGGGSGTGTTLSAVVTTVAANAWIADCAIGRENAGLTVGAGQTARVNRIVDTVPGPGAIDGMGLSTVNGKATPGAETMDWTQLTSDWTLSAVSLTPATVTPITAPSIATLALTATNATLTYGTAGGAVPPTIIRVASNPGGLDTVVEEPIANFPGGVYTHIWLPGTTYACFYARDAAGTLNTTPADNKCGVPPVAAVDTTAPVMSNGRPTATLPAGTTSATILLDTNEPATCRWNTTDVAYTLMVNFFTAAALTQSATVTGLTNGSTNTYYARCIDPLGNTDLASLVITVIVANSTVDVTAPTTVTNLVATAISQSQVSLIWAVATDASGIFGYQVYMSLGDGNTTYLPVDAPVAANATVVNIPPSTVANFVVKAIDNVQNYSAANSNVATVTTLATLDFTPPTAMTNLRVVASYKLSVLLSWDQGTDTQSQVFSSIEQCAGAACSNFGQIRSLIGGSNIQLTLTPSTTYCWRGLSSDSAGNPSASYSNTVCGTTTASGLDQPRQLVLPGMDRLPRLP